MNPRNSKLALGGLLTGWAAALAIGGVRLWNYESAAGAAAHPPLTWVDPQAHSSQSALPTLVMLIHPQCPCSRATIEELSRLMTQCHGKLKARVLMLRPQGVPVGWERTDLWTSAAAIPGVTVEADEDGRTAQTFGAATSGQAIVYSAEGRLLFAGGITESRGHAGDNAGRSAIVDLVLGHNAGPAGGAASTPVYGCPLFNSDPNAPKGKGSCRN